MDLTLHRPGDHHFIRSFGPEGITVKDKLYREGLVLSAEAILENWPVKTVQELGEQDLLPILEMNPEVVLLGTGAKQSFPEPRLVMKFYEKGIGFEAMTTEAACRTFNVLVSENRNVVAALMAAHEDT
jgi:uncharacterized protein